MSPCRSPSQKIRLDDDDGKRVPIGNFEPNRWSVRFTHRKTHPVCVEPLHDFDQSYASVVVRVFV